MRVVKDSAKSPAGRRAGEGAVAGSGAGATGTDLVEAGAAAGAAAKARLPLLQAVLFLAACAIGGVAIALVRPFGIS